MNLQHVKKLLLKDRGLGIARQHRQLKEQANIEGNSTRSAIRIQ